MLYTTYFAKLRDLPDFITPVAICGKSPDWYRGLQYKKLAPKWSFFSKWRVSRDNHFYIQHFMEEVLDPLNPLEIHQELIELTNNSDIALVCYESPEKFCHRHLVRNWFMEYGFPIKEFGT